MKKNEKLIILGSTGSIGTQALDVCRLNNKPLAALTAHNNIALLEKQAREFHPEYVCTTNKALYSQLKVALADTNVKVAEDINTVATLPCDMVLNSLVGIAGLAPTIAAINSESDIALANKETLVCGGKYITSLAEKKGVKIFPVDSEHSAIWQCLDEKNGIKKILLTASGGAFFGKKKSDLAGVKVETALSHPNWNMGAKVTIDSGTLMNKGLEFHEAIHLFGVLPNQIEILVHRQSIVHSAVVFDDGAVIAQMGVPDMKLPIAYAILRQKRTALNEPPLDLTQTGSLTFEKPDFETFTPLKCMVEAANRETGLVVALNAINEVSVERFIKGEINFTDIFTNIENVFAQEFSDIRNYEDIIETDNFARKI
ncbi:MAG: 1-deoxy-D-xylulose-5-phosphate reductoisomerase [Ruminococcus sp.]|nr:1-deoxy-D-xylulose-5-phosphate reductoisomerase [Ruminococcus sp.]